MRQGIAVDGFFPVWHARTKHRSLPVPANLRRRDLTETLDTLKPAAFQSCFEQWVNSLRLTNDEEGKADREVIAIDGKALRRSHDRKNDLGPLFLVSAWSVQNGISLGQLATAEKSNEITAIPELIESLDLRGAIVTIDAAGCQRDIATKIIDGGGDYVLALKGNQGNFHRSVLDWIIDEMDNDYVNVTMRKYEETVKGHGRVDTLIYYQYKVPDTLPGRSRWPRLRTIGVVHRISKQGDKETSLLNISSNCW